MNIVLHLLKAMPQRARSVVETLFDYLVAAVLALIAGGLETIPSPLAVHIPLIAMALVFYAGASGMLYAGTMTLINVLKQLRRVS